MGAILMKSDSAAILKKMSSAVISPSTDCCLILSRTKFWISSEARLI